MTSVFDQFPDADGERQVAPTQGSSVFDKFPDAKSEMQGGQPEGTPGTRVANPGTEAFAAGAVESSMVGAGMFAGARLGQPAGPWGMAAGAVGGAVVGAVGGEGLREAIGLRTPQQMAPDQRPLAESMYSIGGGTVLALTPYGLVRSGVQLLDRGIGKFFNAAVKQAQRSPKIFAAIEGAGVVSAGAGAGLAESVDPGDQLTRLAGEIGGAVVNPIGRAVTVWNLANGAFTTAMSRYGRNAQEVKLGQEIVALMREHGSDPEMVGKILAASNPYGLTAAQLTGDPALVAMERALGKSSDKFARETMDRGKKARDAMTMQINLLKADGNPEHVKTIAELRKLQFESLMGGRIEAATQHAKAIVEKGVRKGLTDENLGEISARARTKLDKVNDDAEDFISELYGEVNLNVPVEMKRTQQVIDEILEKSADTLKGEKIPAYLMETLRAAKKNAGSKTTYDPNTFVISDVPAGPAMSDSRNLIDLRRKLLSDARAAESDASKAMQAGINKRLQSAIMDDLDVAFTEGLDESYDAARAANKAYHDAFSRTFAGDARAVNKAGADVIDPKEMLKRAFATGGEAANIKLKDLEDATRFMITRGMGDEGSVEVMLKAQEDAYRLLTTASMKGGRINPDTMVETIRKNGVLFNRPPFTSVRDDLLQAVKSENGLRRLEDFVKRRNSDIGKKSAFAQISGSNPVDYASKILVSTGDQETQFIKMFNLAKKGGTNRQGVQIITPEQGVSSARASVLNAAFNRSISKDQILNLDTFRGLLFTPNVAGQKSPITIMREQGVIEPEHVKNLSAMFNTLENIKIAERQGTAIDVKQGAGELGLILGAKILASKAVSMMQRATGQSGSSIIVHGAVAKGAEAVASKIPTARAQDMAILLMNDPTALANVLKKETTDAGRRLQIDRFYAWAIQSGVASTREDELLSTIEPSTEPEMFSQ